MYIPLRTHTPYSIAEGAARANELAAFCLEHNIPALGVADTLSLGGSYSLKESMKSKGIQPLHGVLIKVNHPGIENDTQDTSTLVLYAQTETGYEQICSILSKTLLEPNSLTLKDFLPYKETGEFLVLTGGIDGPVDKAITQKAMDKAEQRLKSLAALFPKRLWVELQRQSDKDIPRTTALLNLANTMNLPIVATHQAWYVNPSLKGAHDILLCIAQNMTLEHTERRKTDIAGHILTPADMLELFKDTPQAVENTISLAQSCTWFIKDVDPVLPKFPGLTQTEAEALREKSFEGLAKRMEKISFIDNKTAYGYSREDYIDRLNYELSVIENMGFPGYFLIVADFIQWAKNNDIPVGPGRGSGAGSIVAWALTITDLDPLRYGLYFERFLNPERVSMPDFDIDFCQERRDEVISYVRNHYGADHVAQIGTLGKLQARAVVKSVGRTLQLPYPLVDRYVKLIPNNPAHPVGLKDAMAMEPLATQIQESDETIKKMFDIGVQLEGLYSHTSTHAAGVVIGNRPVGTIVPVYKDAHGITVTGYDMKGVEKAGLVKFDFLGLKTLDVIKGTLDILAKENIHLDFDTIGVDDAQTYAMLRNGDAFGVFQLESAGMRKAMLQIQPTCIEDIIALVALYRPGPMENIPVYAQVKAGEQDPGYLHPLMEETLKETHGIIVYQEQVMKLAQDMAGYSLGGADLLRRAMGKKIKAEMDAQEAVFLEGAQKNNIDPAIAKQTFDLIAKFANYGFNKSHAAAYAVIAFQTAYLRCHHREAFMASTMNLDLNDVEKIAEALEDARRFGLHHGAPDINRSEAKFTVKHTHNKATVLHGLAALRGVGLSMAQQVIEERNANGPFTSLHDLAKRCTGILNKKGLESLIASGACDVFSTNRAALWAAIPDAIKEAQRDKNDQQRGQASLFDLFGGEKQTTNTLPDSKPWTKDESLAKQYDVVGFFLDGHPLDSIRQTVERRLRERGQQARTLRDLMHNDFLPKEALVACYVLDSTFRKTRKEKAMIVLRICDESAMAEALAFEDAVSFIQEKLPKPEGKRIVLTVSPSRDGDDLTLFIRDVELLDI